MSVLRLTLLWLPKALFQQAMVEEVLLSLQWACVHGEDMCYAFTIDVIDGTSIVPSSGVVATSITTST